MLYTVLFGVVLVVLGSVYAASGLFELDVDPTNSAFRRFFVLHLVYGVVLGAAMDVWWVI